MNKSMILAVILASLAISLVSLVDHQPVNRPAALTKTASPSFQPVAIDFESSSLTLGPLGNYSSPLVSGRDLVQAYPSISDWDANINDVEVRTETGGILRNSVDYGTALYFDGDSDVYVEFGPLQTGSLLFMLLTGQPSGGLGGKATVRIYSGKPTSKTHPLTGVQDFEVTNDAPDKGERFCIADSVVPSGGYVRIYMTAQGHPFYVDNLSVGGGPLPVELTSFHVFMKEDVAELRWSTATEINNVGFHVQRSSDQDNWDDIGFVPGAGNSQIQKTYTFTDANLILQTKRIYYRLRQTDRDGSIAYSPTAMVYNSSVRSTKITEAWPNPFNPSTTVSFSLGEDSPVRLRLINLTGSTMKIMLDSELMEAGSHAVTVDAGGLPSGKYLIALETPQKQSVYPVVLMK